MRFQRPPSTNRSHQRQHPGCSCWDVSTDWLCLQLNFVSNETSFSHEPIRLILEPLELDLMTPQVPDRWVPSLNTRQEAFLGATVFLSVTSESANRSPSHSRRCSRILYQDMNCFYMKKDATPLPAPPPHECILTIQTRCVCIRRRLSHISPVLWGHFCSRAVRHFGTPPCINTLAIESCQILHWVSLLPLYLSFSPKKHESTEVQMSWYYFCGQLRTLPKLHFLTATRGREEEWVAPPLIFPSQHF